MIQSKKAAGFTIVELLIVIVVIGILAAIVIVAFNGIQERARLSGATAYAAQIKRSPESVNATALMNFNECSGTAVNDSSEANNDGTIVGTAAWSTDTPSGSGCSINLNGTTSVTTPALIGANYYLKAAWVKVSSCATSNNIISGNGSALYGCALRAGHNGSWSDVNGNINIGDSKWHYVALEYDGGVLEMYVDGKRVAAVSGQPVPSSFANTIGALGGGNNFTGLIDDVTILAR